MPSRVSPNFAAPEKIGNAGGDNDTGSLGDNSTSNDDGFGGELDGALISSGDMDCPYCRKPFRQPRLLMCLHSFCEDCIIAMLEGRSDDKPQNALDVELESSGTCETQPPPGVVRCPVCKQDSQIGNDLRFVQSLVPDFVTMNIQDANALEQMQLVCESCKAKEKAVARCVDCANVLCPNCVQAHQFMRCFENHKVLTFEEIKNSSEDFLIHKPILCNIHTNEHVRFFCNTCRIPVCNECLLTTHKFADHLYLKSTPETDAHVREQLQKLTAKGRTKIVRCDGESHEMETKLQELQDSVEEAKTSVEFVFDKYQELLNKRRDQTLSELNRLQRDLETKIMRTSQQIANTSEKIRDALGFSDRLLKHGNTMEILCTLSMVEAQMLQVIHSVPSAQFSVRVNFLSDEKTFEDALNKHTGYFHADLEQRPPPPQNYGAPYVGGGGGGGDSDSFFGLSNGLNALAAYPAPVSSNDTANLYNMPMSNNAVEHLNDSISQISLNGDRKSRLSGNSSTDSAGGGLGGWPNSSAHLGSGMNSFMHYGNMNLGVAASSSSSSSAANINSNSHILEQNIKELVRLGPSAYVNPYAADVINGTMNSGTISPSNAFHSKGNRYLPANQLTVNTSRNVSPLDSLGTVTPSLSAPYGIGRSGSYARVSPPSDVSSGSSNGLLQGLPPNVFSSQAGAAYNQSSSVTGLNPPIRQGHMNHVTIHSRIGTLGPMNGQFNSPHGFCLSADEDIVVADTNNHRIQMFTKNGEWKGEFGVAGKEEGQLWYPRKVAMLRNSGKFIVCDRGNERSRMQLFSRSGHFSKKIAIRYIDIVAGLAIDQEGRVVAVDSVSPTVFCIDENGELVHWFDCSNQMKEPSDIAVFQHEYFICDFKGHCVCVFSEQGHYLRKIGCEGVTNFPNGIDISDHGDILVGDSHGNRFHVAVFKKSGELQTEFECPQVKVSRCCGLRITSEGYIITIAKNNHHVLILNTLYVA